MSCSLSFQGYEFVCDKLALSFLMPYVCVYVYRQPPTARLFPSGPGFVAVSEAVVAGVSSTCLLVATQAANAASALFRYTQTHTVDT